jgi:glycosyltransferase involved in cell wall biosynthesis
MTNPYTLDIGASASAMKSRVSVCMATYNGAKYLREQLDSIFPQLQPEDELVISDDHSTDDTQAIIQRYTDQRVRLIVNPSRRGHVQNFAHAISQATGEFIALSDQDDIWVEGRLERMVNQIRRMPRYSLVVGDFSAFGGNDSRPVYCPPLGPSPSSRAAQMARIFMGTMKYFGCVYLFKRDLTRYILPIPSYIEAHDIWIAMNACVWGRIGHLEEITTLRRLHGANLTPSLRRSLPTVLKSRALYAAGLVKAGFRGQS